MPQHSSSLSNERNRRLAGCQAVCTITKPIVGVGAAGKSSFFCNNIHSPVGSFKKLLCLINAHGCNVSTKSLVNLAGAMDDMEAADSG